MGHIFAASLHQYIYIVGSLQYIVIISFLIQIQHYFGLTAVCETKKLTVSEFINFIFYFKSQYLIFINSVRKTFDKKCLASLIVKVARIRHDVLSAANSCHCLMR